MEARSQENLQLERVTSVASFSLGRIDMRVDPLLEKLIETGGGGRHS